MPRIFEHRSILPATVEAVEAFHNHPKAFQRLTPPPIIIQVHRRELTSLQDGEVEFTMWFGFIPIRWLARHEVGSIDSSFVDRQIKGPLKSWRHEHIFQATENGVELIDHLEIEHYPGWRGWLTRLFFDGLPLRFLFIYRHLRTRWGVRGTT